MTVAFAAAAAAIAFVDSAFDSDFAAAATIFDVVASADAYAALVAASVPVASPGAFPNDAPLVAPSATDAEDGPPLPPQTVDRISLAKLELRVEKYPPANPVAPADLAGSWAVVGSSRLSIGIGH